MAPLQRVDNEEWVYFYVHLSKVDNELRIIEFVPESIAEYGWRMRKVGTRLLVQWYDDALREWTDHGVYKNLPDVAEELVDYAITD